MTGARCRLTAGLLGAGLALLAQSSHSAPLNAANDVRSHGCEAAGSRTSPRAPLRAPLFYSIKLEQAAKRYSQGASLQRAAADSGYLAAEIAGIHLSGPAGDAEVEQMLMQRDCRTLLNPKMREFAAVRRGREIWMVLAAPVALPERGDAASLGKVVLDLVNSARATGRRCGGKFFAAAAPLALDPMLTQAAQQHSRDMAEHDAFDHQGFDGSSPATRVERAGFKEHRIVGENIAAGAMTATEVVQGWLASPAHCENIMDGRFTLLGVAYAENLHTKSGVFWTQDFAARQLPGRR